MSALMTLDLLWYLLLGAFAGTAAGLLGIGGGLVIVPALAVLFAQQGIHAEHLMHIAVATSTATIVITSISSVRSHHQMGAVDWGIVRRMAPGLILGAAAGTILANYLSSDVLKRLFGLLEILVALQIGFGRQPSPHRQLPGPLPMTGVSGGVGLVASLMGMGGGALTTPFFLWCNVAIRNAIATSAAVGLPISVAATTGYILTGLGAEHLPAGSLGFVYLPAFLAIVVASFSFAPVGAWLAHTLPVLLVKRIFAAFLVLLGLNMLLR